MRARARLIVASALLASVMLLLLAATATAAATNSSSSTGGSEAVPANTESPDDIAQEEETKAVAEHPFLELHGILNGSWFKFFVIVVAASRLALVFPKLPFGGLPLITGYMIIGCLCGPYVLGLVSKPQIPDLSYVTQTALSFIAFSAGSELYLPELRTLIRTIMSITGANALFSYLFCTLFIYGIAAGGVVPWMSPYLGSCAFSISLVFGSIMVARSPASAIAVVRELRAKGPATSIMLGVTVVGDVVVLILFTISTSFALAMCSGGGLDGGALMITLLTLVVAVGVGYGLGFVLIFLLWVPRVPARYTILPLGFLIFVICDWLVIWTEEHWGFGLNFDALLICITAGYVATNKSHNRVAFLKMLGGVGPYIFMPFFTLVGVQLNLPILVQSIAFGVLVFLCRALCIIAGSYVGGRIAGLDEMKQKKLWMTMLAQAGVSLGLASEVAVKFPEWGSKFQTTCISVVLINQFVGPVLCKIALRQFGEAGKMTDDGDEHGEHGGAAKKKKLKRAVLFGVDSTSLSVAAKLLKAGWRVSLVSPSREALLTAGALGIQSHETNSCLEGGDEVLVTSIFDPSVQQVHVFDERATAVWTDGKMRLEHDEHGEDAVMVGPQEPRLDLVLAAGDGTEGSVARYGAALDANMSFTGVEAVILGLESDIANYELGVWLLRTRRAPRVLVRTHNPMWSDNFRQQGMLPVSELASTSSVLAASAQSQGNLQLVSATLSLQDALAELLSPVEDLSHLKLPMDGEQRAHWEEQNPDPSADAFESVAERLRAAGMDDEQIEGVNSVSGDGGHESLSSAARPAMSMSGGTEGLLPPSAADEAANASMGMGLSINAMRDEEAKEERQQRQ